MTLDGPVIVALAALAGSLVGAFSSVAAAFIGQRQQARWTQLRAELEERENLYGLFVEEAVHLFVDAIQGSKIDPVKIMRLYSKVARIRLMSTDQVLKAAEEVGKRLFQAYERPPDDPTEGYCHIAPNVLDAMLDEGRTASHPTRLADGPFSLSGAPAAPTRGTFLDTKALARSQFEEWSLSADFRWLFGYVC